MKRRHLIALLGGAAAWPPLAARAQSSALPVIGFLHSGSPEPLVKNLAAFRQGLGDVGYVEGRNVAFDFRFAESRYDRLPALAAELTDRNPAVIVAAGATDAPLAVKHATSTIPIVFITGSDPSSRGLVASLNRPEANVTGATFFSTQLGPKRLELLHEAVPKSAAIGMLVNPNNPSDQGAVEAAARTLGLQLHVANAGSADEFDAAFAALVQKQVGALLVGTDALFSSRIEQLVALASRHKLPTIYFLHEFAAAGGLMSYGASITGTYRQGGDYAGRILKGAKPADLPVVQPTKFELVINLETAKSLALPIPPSLLARADEVIE